MKRLFFLLIFILLLFTIYWSFVLFQFTEGVNEDTRKRFSIAKNYIHGISFKGIIVKKSEIGNNEIGKEYFIDIALDKIDSLPTISQRVSLGRYCDFKGDSILCLSIPCGIYTNIELYKPITKLANSNYLKIQNDKILFLSSVSDQWFSCQ